MTVRDIWILSLLIAILMSNIAIFTIAIDYGWSLLNIILTTIAILILTGEYWA